MTTLTATPDTTQTVRAPMPKLWAKFSVRTGTLVQLASTAAGAACLYATAQLHAAEGVRIALLIVGWLTIYLSSHAIAHVAVGQAVGIRFRAYGVRGRHSITVWRVLSHRFFRAVWSPRRAAAAPLSSLRPLRTDPG